MRNKKVKLVFIQWDDAREDDDEDGLQDTHCIQTTVGLQYASDRWTYSIARDYNPLTEKFEKCIKITKKMVTDYKLLGEKIIVL